MLTDGHKLGVLLASIQVTFLFGDDKACKVMRHHLFPECQGNVAALSGCDGEADGGIMGQEGPAGREMLVLSLKCLRWALLYLVSRGC